MSEERFRIGPEIVHETVDGEVIAIDLANGSYYSLAGSGPTVWELLGQGATEAEVREALAARYEGDETEIASAVATLLGGLREHALILAAEEGEGAGPSATVADGEKRPFEAPRLERYDDMKDYFLLDPIHEVNPEAGWPEPAPR